MKRCLKDSRRMMEGRCTCRSSALLPRRFARHAGGAFRPKFHVAAAVLEQLLKYRMTELRHGLAKGHNHVQDEAGLQAE